MLKMSSIIKDIPSVCKMSYESHQNSQLRKLTYNNMHPIIPTRGEIYNAFITEGVGKELSGNHPVVVIQGRAANMYSDKVNVLPIEGDGNKIKSSYQEPLTSDDLEGDTTLLKEQSRIITSDILTLDKARLGKKVGKIKEEKMLIIKKFYLCKLFISAERLWLIYRAFSEGSYLWNPPPFFISPQSTSIYIYKLYYS